MICTSYFTYETDAAYPDLGPDQRMNHRGLLRVLQEAAAIASDEVGFGMKDIPRNGVFWILSGWRLELLERPQWRDHLTVQTWPRAMDGFTSERDFLVYNSGKLAARASSRWLLVNTSTGRAARVSSELRAAYEMDGRVLFDTPIPSNGKTPEGTPAAFSTTIGRRDIDTNHHVNNICYFDYALEALPQAVYENLPATVEVAFRRQILLGTSIRCLYVQLEDGRHQVEIQSGQGKETVRHAFVWFY